MIHTIGTTLAKILIAPIIFLMSVTGYAPVQETQLGATLPISGQTYTLAGSGVSAAATSITLSSLTLPQTGYKILDADMSAIFYLTLEPGNRTKQEIVSCTTVTQNANDTATLSGCSRGLLPISPYTASSTYAFAHGGGTSVIFSNPPQLYNQFTAKDNDETITGTWTFDNFPITASTTYASETVTGSVRLATATEIASSTTGSSTERRVIPAVLSTSTAPASGHVIPVTGSDGNLAEGFLPTLLSDTYVSSGAYGNGSDGDVTINTPTTLTRDMYYDDLVINSTLNTAGWRVFAKNSVSGSGSIIATGTPGTNASGITPGTGGSAVVGFTKNSAGGNGGAGAENNDCSSGTNGGNTSSGVSLISSTSNTGGTVGGNDGACGPIAPGNGGTVTAVATTTKYGEIYSDTIAFSHISYSTSTRLWSSAGGSGGGGGSASCASTCNGTIADTGAGGGGGASGQIVLLASKLISGTFTIDASGGNGGNGGNGSSEGDTTAIGGGGGGGGNGGTIVLIYDLKTHSGTITANGGTGGLAGGNGGVAGANGATGLIFNIPLSNLLR